MLNWEAALRQLAWALHLILAGKTASVNSRQDRAISSCEDEHFASTGMCLKKDYSTHIVYTLYTYTHLNDLYTHPNDIIMLGKKNATEGNQK